MKKTLSLLTMAAVMLSVILSFASCAKLDTTGLFEAAPDLIEASAKMNEIYYGAGIPYDENDIGATGYYYPANKDYLKEMGFFTVAELKNMTAGIFSAAYCDILFQSAFEGFAAEGSGYVYARYSSNQAENLRDEDETILVYSRHTGTTIGQSTYDFSTLSLGEVGKDYATVTLSVKTVYAPSEAMPDGLTTTDVMEIRFVNENGWRIDSPTY